MISHLIKLNWNRKRKNALMLLEILVSFFVLFIAMVVIINSLRNYLKPLGFDYKNVRILTMDWKNTEDEEVISALRQYENILRSYPEVEEISLSRSMLFMMYALSTSDIEYDSKSINAENLYAGDGFSEILNIRLLQGKWFDESDNSSNIEPLVINDKLRQELFPLENPLGKIVRSDDEEFRIVGVIGEFRRAGELTNSGKVMFRRLSLETEAGRNNLVSDFFNRYLIKVKPGTGVDFEAKMIRDLRPAGRNFTIKTEPLAETRDSAFRIGLILPLILLTVCGFFIINVILGFFGVIWYSINRRREEIGLRRALGAPAISIKTQILGEVLVLTSLGILLGSFFALQFPLLNLISFIDMTTYIFAFVAALIIFYLLALVCALYPSALASRIQPAEALRDE